MRAFKHLWQLCFLFGVFLWASCRPDRSFMIVELTGLSAQVDTVEVRAVLEESGLDAIERFDGLTGPSAKVSMWLPSAASGKLTVMAVELQKSCSVGLGTATATVQGQVQVDVAVTLSKPSSVLCEVTIDRTGDGFGIVTVEPPSTFAPLSCGDRCTFLGVAGSTVTLHAQVMAPGYLSKWTGPCKISSPLGLACQVQVGTSGTHVGVEFLNRTCTPGTFCDESPSLPMPPVTYHSYSGIWAASDQDLWVVEIRGGVLHKHGLFWSEEVIPGPVILWSGVYGTSTSDIWLGGSDAGLNGMAVHWDGKTWTRFSLPSSAQLSRVWGNSSNFFLVSARDGVTLQWDGVSWKRGTFQQPGVDISGFWGTEGKNIWLSGVGLYQYNGNNSWIRDPAVSTNSFYTSIWGSSINDYWIVSSGAASLHRVNGTLISAALPDAKNRIYSAIHGTGASDIWSVTTIGEIFHFDGASWKLVLSKPTESYCDVFAINPGDVYVIGMDNGLLHYQR